MQMRFPCPYTKGNWISQIKREKEQETMFKLENRVGMMLLVHSNLDYKSTLPWTSEQLCLLSFLICAWLKGESFV